MSENKNLNDGFEFPNTMGMGARAKRVANIYSSVLDLGYNLPSQISDEVYAKARDAVKAMWDAMSAASVAKSAANGVNYVKSSGLPTREDSFISVAYSYTWSYLGRDLMTDVTKTDVTALIGSVLAPRTEYYNEDEAESLGIKPGHHKVIQFAIWHDNAAYIFTYFSDIDVLSSKVDTIEASRIVKWAYVDEDKLAKRVPSYMLEEALADLY